VFTAVKIQVEVLWVVTTCCAVLYCGRTPPFRSEALATSLSPQHLYTASQPRRRRLKS